jgi:hypothetical protein
MQITVEAQNENPVNITTDNALSASVIKYLIEEIDFENNLDKLDYTIKQHVINDLKESIMNTTVTFDEISKPVLDLSEKDIVKTTYEDNPEFILMDNDDAAHISNSEFILEDTPIKAMKLLSEYGIIGTSIIQGNFDKHGSEVFSVGKYILGICAYREKYIYIAYMKKTLEAEKNAIFPFLEAMDIVEPFMDKFLAKPYIAKNN